jgi:O-antigen/teichoic acid export membrane protein
VATSRSTYNAILLVAARAISKILVLVVVLVTQNALGANQFGQFATVIAISNIASIFNDFGLQVIYLREASKDRSRIQILLANILTTKIPLSLLSGAILVVAIAVLAPSLSDLFVPVYALLIATSLANLLRSNFYATGELRYEVVAIAGETVVLFAATLFAAASHLGTAGYIWAYTASYAFTALFAGAITQRRYAKLGFAWNSSLLMQMLRGGLPLAAGFVLATLYFKIDVLILQGLRGFTQVGYYNAAYKFIEGLSFLPAAAMNAFFPALSVAWREGRDVFTREYTRTFKFLLILGVPATVITAIFAQPIVSLTHALPQAAPALSILGLTVVFIFIVNTYVFALGAIEKQLLFAALTGASVVVNVILNFVMIPAFPTDSGYLASSWATVISEALLLIGGYLAISRTAGWLPWFLPTVKIIASGAVMAVVAGMLASNWLLGVALSGLAYLALIWFLGVIPRAEILELLHHKGAGVGDNSVQS